jgi:hypothetical protein
MCASDLVRFHLEMASATIRMYEMPLTEHRTTTPTSIEPTSLEASSGIRSALRRVGLVFLVGSSACSVYDVSLMRDGTGIFGGAAGEAGASTTGTTASSGGWISGGSGGGAGGTWNESDAGTEPSDAACASEPDLALCARLSKDCGGLSAPDNCGLMRDVASCGTCAAPASVPSP